MRFSRRFPAYFEPSRWAEALDRKQPESFCDLTVTNPTHLPLPFPKALRALAGEGPYEPTPGGVFAHRKTLAEWLRKEGFPATPEDLFLVSGTSEALSYLFKLLADPGEEVLVMTPGYPLHAHLAQLEGVRAVSFELDPSLPEEPIRWPGSSVRPRGVFVVDPHYPTGGRLGPEHLKAVCEACTLWKVPLILDQVFHFTAPPEPAPTFRFPEKLPVIRLGGLSKAFALPHWKLSWVLLEGPEDWKAAARERLEWIADAFLSVSAPVEKALPEVLRHGAERREALRSLLENHRRLLSKKLALYPFLRVLPGEAAWAKVVEVEETHSPGEDQETLAVRLLEEAGVAAAPGFLFDFPSPRRWVISLIVETKVLEEGLERFARFFERRPG